TAALVFAAVVLPFAFPEYKTQLAFLWIFVLFSLTWDLQGGQMGYNSFGNIVFFGVGMYAAAAMQIGMFFDLGAWTEAGGENTYAHSPGQYFAGFAAGFFAAAAAAVAVALLFGKLILSMRGQYFAICTLGFGIAAGEIAASMNIIGAGSGMSVPVWPDKAGGLPARDWVFYGIAAALGLSCFAAMKALHRTRFGLALNAIRDDEDKAEAMGLPAAACKTASWAVSAFFLGLAGALAGHMIGFIDPTEVAFAGATFGVWMVLMAVLGGKGTLWGPVLGAALFQFFKEFFWTYFLGWQYVMLGFLIVVSVVFFPDGAAGFWRKHRAAKAAQTAGGAK
ncbi:MAG: branched-chain amino acid ABC transporter permease, partial [Gammaproteobacteria bacterium]